MTDIIFEKRLPFAAMAIGCAALLGFGYYLEFYRGVEPCPLCILQRICYVGIALVSLLGAVHGARGITRAIYGAAALIAAAGGTAIAARQVWLQHLPPDQVPECGPGLEFMLETYPLTEAVARMLRGTGDCAEVKWTFLGLSIPEWSLICFTLLAVVAFTQAATAFRVRNDGGTILETNRNMRGADS